MTFPSEAPALYEYQKEAVATVTSAEHPTYLAFEMGTGKTPIAIVVAQKRKVKRLLIMCPAVGRLVWQREIRRWWPDMPVVQIEKNADLAKVEDLDRVAAIMSYSRVSTGAEFAAAIRLHQTFDMTVLDEAHALKNPTSNRTVAVLKTMLPVLGFILPMSGTPTPNHPGELFPILRSIFPETVRKSNNRLMKLYEFENTYCKVVNKWFNGRTVRVIEGAKNADILKVKIRPYFLRKTKKQVLPDLPDMTFDTYPVSAPGAPVGPPDWSSMSEAEIEAFMASNDGHVMRMRHQTGLAKVPAAVEAVSDMLDGCRRKVLVFAHHKAVVEGLMTNLAGYNPVRIVGETSPADRELAIKRFLTDDRCRVFVGNITAAGTTITLVGDANEVSDVFFVEASYSPGDNVQAASRIHRIGQKEAVQVWFLTAYGTIDDRIQEILVRKATDFQALFG